MPLCPQCGEEVAVTDTHCMDCGADLLAAKEKMRQQLREQSLASRAGSGATSVPANAAAAGVVSAGDKSSDETRIRVFDRHAAELLAEERKTYWVIGIAALVAGIALLIVGLTRVKAGGGFGEVVPTLKPGELRSMGFGALANATVLGVMFLGSGLGALLVGAGQVRMALAAGRAIADVKRNQKPEIVTISNLVYLGLYLIAVFLSPVGLIVGIVMFLRGDPDAKSLGSTVFIISVAVMAVFGLNMLWSVFDNMRPAAGAKGTK